MTTLAARVGVCGNPDDTTGQIDVERQAAIDAVFAIVRNRMTPELVRAINNPQSAETLEFEVGKALGNIEKWFGKK